MNAADDQKRIRDLEGALARCQAGGQMTTRKDSSPPPKPVSTIALAAVGIAITLISSVVAVTVSYTTVNVNVSNMQTRNIEYREATKSALGDLRVETKSIRADAAETQRRNAEIHQKLTSTTIEIKTLLKVLAEDSRRNATRRR